MDDKLLIISIKRRNEQGLTLLVEGYGSLIRSIINRYLFNLKNYEDECIDDVLLSIWDNIDKYKPKENTFRNWVISISKYKAIDYKRKYLKIVKTQDELDIN